RICLMQTLNLRMKYERKDGGDLPWLDLMEAQGSGVCQVVSSTSAVAGNRPFKFQKRRQLFICSHNETLSVVAVCIDNPCCSPFAIQSRHAAPTPFGFAEIVSCDASQTVRLRLSVRPTSYLSPGFWRTSRMRTYSLSNSTL